MQVPLLFAPLESADVAESLTTFDEIKAYDGYYSIGNDSICSAFFAKKKNQREKSRLRIWWWEAVAFWVGCLELVSIRLPAKYGTKRGRSLLDMLFWCRISFQNDSM